MRNEDPGHAVCGRHRSDIGAGCRLRSKREPRSVSGGVRVQAAETTTGTVFDGITRSRDKLGRTAGVRQVVERAAAGRAALVGPCRNTMGSTTKSRGCNEENAGVRDEGRTEMPQASSAGVADAGAQSDSRPALETVGKGARSDDSPAAPPAAKAGGKSEDATVPDRDGTNEGAERFFTGAAGHIAGEGDGLGRVVGRQDEDRLQGCFAGIRAVDLGSSYDRHAAGSSAEPLVPIADLSARAARDRPARPEQSVPISRRASFGSAPKDAS